MKQIINQNIQFIEYSGRPSSLIFVAILNNYEWIKSILDDINNTYLPIKINYEKLLAMAEANLQKIKSEEPKNWTAGDPAITAWSAKYAAANGDWYDYTTKVDNINSTIKQETDKAYNIPPHGDDIIKPNSLVWVNSSKYRGAYLTQKGTWIPIPSVTNLYTRGGKKLYSTDQNNPAYMVNNLSDPSDIFNQIPKLDANEGYILLSQTENPYVLYEYQNLDNTNTNPHIIFNIPKCMEDNGILTSNFIDSINKVLTFDELLGVCDNFEQASILVSFNVYNLKPDTTYSIRVNSANNNILIENNEFILDNTDSKQNTFSTNIKFLNEITNSVFHIYVSLYSNETLIDKDVVSIFVNCPKKPDPTPLPPKVQANISII